ncbi:LysE family translocator, partial [Mammaliicoccus vitulinus]
ENQMLSFLIYIFVTSITPGPSNIFILNASKNYGIKGSKNFIAGVLTGFLFLAVISLVTLQLLKNILPQIEIYLEIFGFVYLIYLAYKIYKSKNNTTNKTYSSFKSGFFIQILNIKTLLFFISLIGAFILAIANNQITTIFYMILTVLVGWLCLLTWGILGSVFKNFLDKYDKPVSIIMSLLLVYSAISILM